MSYDAWFDDEKGKRVLSKIQGGAEAYRLKHGAYPGVCLLNQVDYEALRGEAIKGIAGMVIREGGGLVRPNHFYFARSEESAGTEP